MGKRGNGEGSISRRKDGLYMARYMVQTATGTKRKTVYGKTRAEANKSSLGRWLIGIAGSSSTPRTRPWASTWTGGSTTLYGAALSL